MSAEKRSISAPKELYAKADARKEALGYATFSDYIQALIRADTMSSGGHVREATAEYKSGEQISSARQEELGDEAIKHLEADYGHLKPKKKSKKTSPQS